MQVTDKGLTYICSGCHGMRTMRRFGAADATSRASGGVLFVNAPAERILRPARQDTRSRAPRIMGIHGLAQLLNWYERSLDHNDPKILA